MKVELGLLFVEEGWRVISGKKTGTLHGGGEGRPRCMGVGRSGNEMRRWSWWSLKTKGSEGESPHLKDDRGFLVFGMKVI